VLVARELNGCTQVDGLDIVISNFKLHLKLDDFQIMFVLH